MATKEEKIAKLEQRIEQSKAKLEALRARDEAQERKDETRRKILIGGFVLAQMKKKGIGFNQMTYEDMRFVDTLKADRDRILFGQKPLPKPAAEPEAVNAAQPPFPAPAGGGVSPFNRG